MFEPGTRPILVSALDVDLRHSLAFLLATEGFAVESCATWPPEYKSDADIVIVDEASLPRPFRGDSQLNALGPGVVLLTSKTELARRLPAATIVRKPLLDRALIEALQTAIGKTAGGGDEKSHK